MTAAAVGMDLRADWGSLKLDDVAFPAQQVGVQPQARFQGRVIFGDPSKDDDDLLSADVQNDFSGGGQIEDRNEGSDQGRFDFATLHTRDPNATTLAREVVVVTTPVGATGAAAPLGDIAGKTFVTYGGDIHEWDEVAGDMVATATATLTDEPVGQAILFGSGGPGSSLVLWIPQGADGYQTFDGTTANAQVNTITPVVFQEHDGRLFAFCTDSQIMEWDGANWMPIVQMDRRHEPKHLLSYFNRSGDQALHAVTSRGLYAIDTANGVIYSTDLLLPPHPDVGLGAALWAGGGLGVAGSDTSSTMSGDLFVSVATLTYRYSLGATNAPIGPERDDGLPAEFRGRIVSLCAEHNGLYALIEGASIQDEVEQDAQIEAMPQNADQFYSGAVTSQSTLMVFNGIGWHTAWTAPEAGSGPTRLMMSATQDRYRLWWGFNGQIYTINLPRDFHKPRQGLEAGVDRFQSSGYLETAWFDAQMEGFRKLASHLTINVPRCTPGVCSIVFKYAVDFDTTWTTLGDPIVGKGKRIRDFGFVGKDFQRIRFRIEMESTSPLDSPLLANFVLHYTKIPLSAGSWTIAIPMFFEGKMFGRTAAEMAQELDDHLSSAQFIKLTLGTKSYRTRLTGMTGNDATGNDPRNVRQLTLAEVVLPVDQNLEVA